MSIHHRAGLLTAGFLSVLLFAACSSSPQTVVTDTQGDHQPRVIIWENSNSHSNNEATLQLVVRAGSLQETDDQLGYAHFVEHMVFRGTENFPGSAMKDQLREFNVDIGHHSNAYVTFDHTAYWLDLNSVEPERLEAGIEILSEWAFRANFDPDDVDSERSVVLEEWRMTEPESDRASQLVYNEFYADSRYLERHPIGTEASIRNATPAGLRTFYDTWYRPDNMAIIVTGDVDREEINALVDQYFPPQTDRPLAEEPAQWDINPEAMNPRFTVTDPFIADGYADLRYFRELPDPTTEAEMLEILKVDLAMDILLDRLENRVVETQGAVAQFIWDRDYPSPNVRVLDLGVQLVEDDFEQALSIMENERQRLLSEGIRQSELDDAISSLLKYERSHQDSAGHLAGVATDHYLSDWPMLAQPDWLALLEDNTPDWTTESVTAALSEAMAVSPQVRVVHPYHSAPPSAEQIDGWLAAAAWVPDDVDRLPEDEAQAADWTIDPTYEGTIEREQALDHGVTEWTLSNGMTVYHQHVDASPGEVNFQLVGLGGFNRMDANDVVIGRLTAETMAGSGLRSLDGPALNQWQQNQAMSLEFGIDFYDRVIYGDTPTDRLGLAMNLVHIALTEAEVDPELAAHQRNQNLSYLQQLEGHPHQPWFEILNEELYLQEPALRTLTIDEVENTDTEQMQAFYERQVAGAQNYQVAIAGDIDRDEARQHVLSALATIPPTESLPEVKRQLPMPTESGEFHGEGSGERHANISLRYAIPKNMLGDFDATAMTYLEHWLDEVLMDEIRRTSGLAYYVQGDTEGHTRFEDDYALWVHMGTDPERVEEAIDRVEETLHTATTEPPTQQRVDGWQTSLKNDRRRHLGDGSWTANRMAYAELFERDPTAGLDGELSGTDAAALSELLAIFVADEAVRSEFVWMP